MENVRVYQELERRVQQRTSQLEEANRELDAFTFSVSHDLRAPLRHIGGFIELLKRQEGSGMTERGRELLARAESSARGMSQLIDDLLAFSRLGRAAVNARPVGLLGVIHEARQQVTCDVRDRIIEWTLPDDVVVSADAALLRQVVINLLSNAVKYTRGRSPARIHIAAQPDRAQGEVVVSVHDNGTGFDMQYAGRLFGVFQRLHRADEFEGTGVGLATVRRLVQAHGGRVWADAEPGLGATFHFTLPQS